MSAWEQRILHITLEQDVILGATGASQGNLDTLDYLPGSVFLGVAASRLYASLSEEDTWQLFHSGAVRFNDALPIAMGEAAWPMPLSWHHYKGEAFKQPSAEKGIDSLYAERIFDPVLFKADAQRQPKQVRKGYVSASGRFYNMNKTLRMKTALDASTGRAAEGQLFGYQSLDAGQSFCLVLQAKAEQVELLNKVVESLTGELRLGRSRSAQYGRVRAKLLSDAATASSVYPPATQDDPHSLTLWLLSDMALTDHNGQPTVQPHPDMLGLPEGSEWLSAESFLRTRSYSPYNAYRRSHDEERQVISRGSVLRFHLGTPLSNGAREMLEKGIGVYQSAGLGRVAINAELTRQAQPQFAARVPVAGAEEWQSSPHHSTAPATPETSRLLQAIARRAKRSDKDMVADKASELFGILQRAVSAARVWQGVAEDQPIEAPNRSQWGRVKALANQYRHEPKILRSELYQGEQAVIRQRSGWALEIGPGETLAQQAAAELDRLEDSELVNVVGRLAALGLTSHWERVIQGSHTMQQPGGAA